MIKRDTRVQIIILQDGKYILLKHHAKKMDKYFWGIPGGGKEEGETEEMAAKREAFEETGLVVELLPVKFEHKPMIENSIYNRTVTFIAYPLEGEARLGIEPESEMQDLYELVDIKWVDYFKKSGIDEITLKTIEEAYKYLKENLHNEGKKIKEFYSKNVNLCTALAEDIHE